jgi:hypothetical protein
MKKEVFLLLIVNGEPYEYHIMETVGYLPFDVLVFLDRFLLV